MLCQLHILHTSYLYQKCGCCILGYQVPSHLALSGLSPRQVMTPKGPATPTSPAAWPDVFSQMAVFFCLVIFFMYVSWVKSIYFMVMCRVYPCIWDLLCSASNAVSGRIMSLNSGYSWLPADPNTLLLWSITCCACCVVIAPNTSTYCTSKTVFHSILATTELGITFWTSYLTHAWQQIDKNWLQTNTNSINGNLVTPGWDLFHEGLMEVGSGSCQG